MKTASMKCIALVAIGIAATVATQTSARADCFGINCVSVGASDTFPRQPQMLGLRGGTRTQAAGTHTVHRQEFGVTLTFTPVVRSSRRGLSIR